MPVNELIDKLTLLTEGVDNAEVRPSMRHYLSGNDRVLIVTVKKENRITGDATDVLLGVINLKTGEITK